MFECAHASRDRNEWGFMRPHQFIPRIDKIRSLLLQKQQMAHCTKFYNDDFRRASLQQISFYTVLFRFKLRILHPADTAVTFVAVVFFFGDTFFFNLRQYRISFANLVCRSTLFVITTFGTTHFGLDKHLILH